MILVIKSVATGKWVAHHIFRMPFTSMYKVSDPVAFNTHEEALAYRRGYEAAKVYHELTGKFVTPSVENSKIKMEFLDSKRASGGVVFDGVALIRAALLSNVLLCRMPSPEHPV